VKVRSDWNWSAYLFSTDWNRSMSPERIAGRLKRNVRKIVDYITATPTLIAERNEA
jgi:hypothetical protein